MGLIKAAGSAISGVVADQWKEYFYCDSIPVDVIVRRGQKRVSGRSSNVNGEDNIISKGSVIAVADGQCMAIVEQGKVVEFSAEPGEFVFDSSTEPSVFAGSFGTSLLDTFKTIGKRFTFGGDTAKDQRVYYFNTKELVGNKYGTPSPVPFRVVDQRAGIDMDIGIRCFGEYSYHLCDPILFYTNVCGNIAGDYNRSQLDSQLRSELLTALQPAFARISEMGIRYSALPGHTTELAGALNKELSAKWHDLRGIEIVSFGVSSVTANEEDERNIKELQRNAAFKDPTMAAAHLVGAQAAAMQSAAKNEGAGPAMAFMGMNMANGAGGANVQNLYAMGQQQAAAAPAADAWKCSCGATVSGNFCPNCGAKKPEPKPAADAWKCTCGATVSGNFCPNCGAKKPEAAPADGSWKCACGAVNDGNFCPSCGAKKPAAEPTFKCSKCGWEPEDPKNPPKFCPNCGDAFNSDDEVR